jgi:hypothetical protein
MACSHARTYTSFQQENNKEKMVLIGYPLCLLIKLILLIKKKKSFLEHFVLDKPSFISLMLFVVVNIYIYFFLRVEDFTSKMAARVMDLLCI